MLRAIDVQAYGLSVLERVEEPEVGFDRNAALCPLRPLADPDQDLAVAPDARQQVRALVARERSGGPKVSAAEVIAATGRSRRRAYELLRDARTEQG